MGECSEGCGLEFSPSLIEGVSGSMLLLGGGIIGRVGPIGWPDSGELSPTPSLFSLHHQDQSWRGSFPEFQIAADNTKHLQH